MIDQSTPPFRDVRVPSPGEGAFRFKLFGTRGQLAHEGLLVGGGDHTDLLLEDGRYDAIVERVGDDPRSAALEVSGARPEAVWRSYSWADPLPPKRAEPPTLLTRAIDEKRSLPVLNAPLRRTSALADGDRLVAPRLPVADNSWWRGAIQPRSRYVDRDTSVPARTLIHLGQQRWVTDGGGRVVFGSRGGMQMHVDRPDDWHRHPVRRFELDVAAGVRLAFNLPLFAGGATLDVRFGGEASEARTIVAIEPRDAKVATLTRALHSAFPEEVDRILDWSGGVMAGSGLDEAEDPWKTAAGLLLLTRIGRAGDHELLIRWFARHYSWLSDGEVCLAYALAAIDSKPSAMLNALKRARRKGYPCFALSATLALDLASALADSPESGLRIEAEKERRHWQRWASKRVSAGLLFCIEQTSALYRGY